jgi:hypothetical protein
LLLLGLIDRPGHACIDYGKSSGTSRLNLRSAEDSCG